MDYNFGKDGLRVNGVPITGAPDMITGSVFFVHSGTGGDAGGRGTVDKPFATIDYAVGKCTANKGDVIYVMPGHYEDLADTSTTGAIDLDVAGISVIGLGNGSLVPRIDFNHADSDFLIGADNILVQNIHFDATVTGVKVGINVEAGSDYCTIKGCRFTVETSATDEFLDVIQVNVVSNFAAIGNMMDMGLGGGEAGIHLLGAVSGADIRDNRIIGDYSDACIFGETTLSTDVFIEDNMLVNGNANALGAVACIVLVTNSISVIRRNTMFADVATHLLICTADTCLYSDNDCSDDSGSGATTAKVSATVVASTDG